MGTAASATRVFGWTAAALVVAALWSLFLIPDSSDPNYRAVEHWILLPFTLASVAVAAALVTLVSGCLCLVRREHLDVRTVVPMLAGTGLGLLPVSWATASVLLR